MSEFYLTTTNDRGLKSEIPFEIPDTPGTYRLNFKIAPSFISSQSEVQTISRDIVVEANKNNRYRLSVNLSNGQTLSTEFNINLLDVQAALDKIVIGIDVDNKRVLISNFTEGLDNTYLRLIKYVPHHRGNSWRTQGLKSNFNRDKLTGTSGNLIAPVCWDGPTNYHNQNRVFNDRNYVRFPVPNFGGNYEQLKPIPITGTGSYDVSKFFDYVLSKNYMTYNNNQTLSMGWLDPHYIGWGFVIQYNYKNANNGLFMNGREQFSRVKKFATVISKDSRYNNTIIPASGFGNILDKYTKNI